MPGPFPCCGTGEFFSLSEQEYERLVTIAVEEAGAGVGQALPVIVGIGYGWPQAANFARAAERAGADGALVLTHYLVNASQAGLVEHVREIAGRTSLPLIVYQRDNVKYSADSLRQIAEIRGVIGLKDGHGELDQLRRLTLAAPEEFLFFNGTPTAEMQVMAYRTVGIEAYSSAVHAFAPEIANSFFSAVRKKDHARITKLIESFYWPLVELRDRQPGYAVSLVKAGARLRGQEVGPVRAPLTKPSPSELAELEAIIAAGLEVIA